MARKYLIVIERASDGKYGAHVPDLPGCAVCGHDSPEEAKESIAIAIEMHIQGMLEDGDPVPEPVTQGDYVETTAA